MTNEQLSDEPVIKEVVVTTVLDQLPFGCDLVVAYDYFAKTALKVATSPVALKSQITRPFCARRK